MPDSEDTPMPDSKDTPMPDSKDTQVPNREETPLPDNFHALHDLLHNPGFNPPSFPEKEKLDPKYNFRDTTLADQQNFRISNDQVDQDESGDYDPHSKASQASSKRKRLEENEPLDTIVETPGETTDLTPKLLVTLKFTTEEAKDSLYSITYQRCPTAIDIERAEIDRERARERAKYHGRDPPDLSSLALGNPARRGCKACFAIGEDCPLLGFGEASAYPCSTCVKAGINCDMIVQPALKRGCEACNERRIMCSYRKSEDNHDAPCQQCAATDHECFAGPFDGGTRTGPSLDSYLVANWFSMKARYPGLFENTARLRAQNRRHLISPGNVELSVEEIEEGERRQSERGSSANTQNPARKAKIGKHAVSSATTVEESKPAKEAAEEPVGRTMHITTRLAHPIMFNYVRNDPPIACHWCDDLVYGLLGLEEKEVEVIDYNDGQGYIEVEGGHTAAGHLPSRMCMSCTTERFKILGCQGHQIARIENNIIDSPTFDSDSVTKHWMLPGMAATAPFAWCSVCPSPAAYKCIRPQPGMEDDRHYDHEDPVIPDGCGLHLCHSCVSTLNSEADGDIDNLIDYLSQWADMQEALNEDGPGAGTFMVRADVGFIHRDGELLRRFPTS